MSDKHIVLFDLGNVLAHIDFDAFWRCLDLETMDKRAPYAAGYKSLTREYETGLIRTNPYLNALYHLFDDRYSIAQIRLAVESIIHEPVDGMLEIVKKVSTDHQTALVSNTNDIHFRLSNDRFEALRILHKHFLSYELHVMKPDVRFYQSILNGFDTPASDMLFVDDLEENVQAAIHCGMQGIRFENVAQFQLELKKLGIL
jgi:glucose-1-phosphatase